VFICLPAVCVCAFRLLCWAIQPNEKEKNPNSSPPPLSTPSLPLQAEIAINIVVVVEQLPDTKIKRNVQKRGKNCKKRSGNSKNEPGEMKEQG